MINVNNVAAADQLHASGRAGFHDISQRAQQLRAQGLDEAKIVANLVGKLGAAMLPKLNGEDDEQFWNALWNVCSALAFATTGARSDD